VPLTVEEKRILVTVKAYPNPSQKYGETVCCAGIDVDTGEWVRLYPIQFRDLDESKKFKKYSIIHVKCCKGSNPRPESYRVDCDSIRVLEWLGTTKDKWESRKRIVIPTLSFSFCDIQRSYLVKTLGMFKPSEVDFLWRESAIKDEAKRKACYAQLSFFDKRKKEIEQVPFDFYYQFKCAGCITCSGHKLPIVDWELGQAYRDWRYKYSP
jgi:hypothetical protein